MGPQDGIAVNVADAESSSKEGETPGWHPDDLAHAEADVDNKSLRENRRLGWKSVVLIIANRMIGE